MHKEAIRAIVKGDRVIHITKTIRTYEEITIEKGSKEWDSYLQGALFLSKSDYENNQGYGSWSMEPFRNQISNDDVVNEELAESDSYNESFTAVKIYIETPDGLEEFIPE